MAVLRFRRAQQLEHAETRAAVTAERAVLASWAGVPGADGRARLSTEHGGDKLFLLALIVSPDGVQMVRKEMQGPVADAAALGRALGEELLAERRKTNSRSRLRRAGMSKVYLVGAGPGDPDLITWKGRKLLATADSVLYDNLANEHLLDLAPKNCERIYVGKKKSVHAFPQEEICAMMIERARRGLTVVRLKGGDPFIFGRGGEEAGGAGGRRAFPSKWCPA